MKKRISGLLAVVMLVCCLLPMHKIPVYAQDTQKLDSIRLRLDEPRIGGSYEGPVEADLVSTCCSACIDKIEAFWYDADHEDKDPETFRPEGHYYVKAKLTAKEGCSFSKKIRVSVNGVPAASVKRVSAAELQITTVAVQPVEKEKNVISQKSVVRSYSKKAQTVQLVEKADLEEAALTYRSSSKKIKVSASGKVTIPAKWSGRATITIKSSETDHFLATTKKIRIIVPTKTTLKKVTSPAAGSLKATWKKAKIADGYQVRYSRDQKMVKAKFRCVKGQDTLKTTIKELASGKKYYVKVRSYKAVGGKKFFSAWSNKMVIKVK